MKNAFSISDVSHSYGGTRALCCVSLECREGEWIALAGRNGSGKSTLIKFLNALLIPAQGSCFVFGLDTADPRNVLEIRKQVAMVFQNPESQIVGVTVEDDAAFALENLCLPSDEIDKRITAALEQAGLSGRRKNLTHNLSGGEKQRLALAGAIAQGARMFLFDEATSMLDPEGRSDMQKMFKKLHDAGHTIVQITHDQDEMRLADRVITLDNGHISSKIFVPTQKQKKSSSTYRTVFTDVNYEILAKNENSPANQQKISVSSLFHTYSDGISKKDILHGMSFDFHKGEIISLLGRTGCGKSTLIQYLNALFLTEKGEVFIEGENVKKNPRAVRRRVGMAFQQPEQQLFAETVREELCFALKNWDIPAERHDDLVQNALKRVGLPLSMLERCPFQLSGGEMRRVAIASVIVSEPEWLVLDEPSSGLDSEGREELSKLIFALKSQGTGIFIVTHDQDFAHTHSDKIIEFSTHRPH